MPLEIDQACAALDVLANEAHTTAKEKGWWENMDRNVPEQLALFHAEISEALEEFRSHGHECLTRIDMDVDGKPGKPGGFPIEIADLFIRVFDTCGRYGVPLGEAMKLKLEYNKSRPHRHGGKHA